MVDHGDALQVELQREQNDLKHEVQALLEERNHLSSQLATGIAPGIFGGRFVPSLEDETTELNKLHLPPGAAESRSSDPTGSGGFEGST